MPRIVLDTTVGHLELEARIGGYEAADQAEEALEQVYKSIARLLRCRPDEVAVVENATRAWDMAFYSVPLGPGDRILTAMNEYASNYIAFLQVTRRTGASVEVVPNDASGQISIDALREMVDSRVKLIAITHVPTNGGLVNPAADIGRVARDVGALYLLDACQSAGQIELDVESIGCDMLSATGRKYLRGPRGTGFLYVRRSVLDRLDPPFLDLHAAAWVARDRYLVRPDARRFENWESNVAGKLGLGAAADYALSWGIDAIERRVATLADLLRQRIATVPGVTVRDLGVRRCGIVTFTVDDVAANTVRQFFASQGMNVTTSTRASTRFDMEERGLTELVRASVHYYNTEDEVERFRSALHQFVDRSGGQE